MPGRDGSRERGGPFVALGRGPQFQLAVSIQDDHKESLAPDRDPEAKAITKAATDAVRELPEEAVEDRIVRLAFGGERERWDQFVAALRETIPPNVTIVIRGSAVIGRRWINGEPFDAHGPGTSDLDLTLVGGEMLKLWKEDAFYIPKLHTVPLSDEAPDVCPVLLPLRRALSSIARRPVNIQATSSIVQYARDVLMDQPYFTVLDADEREEEVARWEAEREARRARRAAEATGERVERDRANGDPGAR